MLHRVRIYNPTPVAVKCLAGAPGKLALGREDGSIEIWSTKNSLCCITRFDSPYKCVEALAFAVSCHQKEELTLFSTGIDGRVVRYNSWGKSEETLLISGSPVWCLEASPSKKLLAAGTEDGYVHIIDTTQDMLVSSKRLQQKLTGRVLSCCWFPCETRLATGSLDSLKIWDVGKERSIESMQLSRVHRKEQAHVFSVVVIDDGAVLVSGDSFGRVIFWDVNSGSQIQSLKLHAADVLVLHACANEVYASGIDPVIFKFYQSEDRWLHQKITQMHTHDIRAIWSEDDRLYTAGVDAQLGVVHLDADNLHYQRILPPSFARNIQTYDNLILVNYGVSVELWTTHPGDKIKLVVSLKTSAQKPFRQICICRTSFAIASSTKISVYKFSLSKDDQLESCDRIFSTEISADLPVGDLQLSPSGRRLFVALRNGQLQLVNVIEETVETRAQINDVPVTCSAVGANIVAYGDVSGNVSVYDHELKFKCSTPKYSGIPIAMSIDKDVLYVAHDDLTFYEFCLKSGAYAPWSEGCLKNSSFEDRLSEIRCSKLTTDGVRDIVPTPADDLVLAFANRVLLARKTQLPQNIKNGLISSTDFLNAVKLWRHKDDMAVCEISGNQLVSKLPPILKKKRFV